MEFLFRKRLFTWMVTKREPANHRMYGSYKKELFHDIAGKVVEVGPGMGGNFRYLPAGIEWIGIEPNDAFAKSLLLKAHERNISATLLQGNASHIPLPDNTADSVISTLVLCSVQDPTSAVAEMKRILKSGGKLYFIEHVAARKGTLTQMGQHIVNPLNRFLFDGCNCNRETWSYFEHGGFSNLELSHRFVKGAFAIHTPHIMGIAVK